MTAGEWALDHDDGSRFMVDESNVCVYGGIKQSYHGYSINATRNIFIRPDLGCGNTYCLQHYASGVDSPKTLDQWFENNTCILGDNLTFGLDVGAGYVDPRQFLIHFWPVWNATNCRLAPSSSVDTQLVGNTIMTPSGHYDGWPCNVSSFAAWQALGFDKRGRVAKAPSAAGTMSLARHALGI